MTDPSSPRGWRAAARAALSQGATAGFVAAFTYWTASLVPFLKETYWAPIAAIVVLYPDREATRKAGGERLLGTLLGSLVGWGAAAWWNGNLLLYGLAVLVAVGLCYAVRLENAARLCAVAVTVITIIPRAEPPHLVALYRCIEVSYGVACAVGFTALVDLAQRRARAR